MDNITQTSYNKEIQDLATQLVEDVYNDYDEVTTREEAEGLLNDTLLHETIDGHQWIIYTFYNQQVLDFTDNGEAYKDVYSNEDLGQLVADKGIEGFTVMAAYFAMYQDVSDLLSDAFDKWDDDHDPDNEVEL